MRSIFKVAVKAVFRRKTYTIAVFALALIAALSLASSFSTLFSTQELFSASYQKSQSPDIFYYYLGKDYKSSFADFFKARNEVKNVVEQDCLHQISPLGSLNGKALASCVFVKDDPEDFPFVVTGARPGHTLADSEAYLPTLFASQYHAKIGDHFTIEGNGSSCTFTIAGFFEDPIFGSVFTGTKRVLLSGAGYEKVRALTLGHSTISAALLNVDLKEGFQGQALVPTAQAMNKAFGNDSLAAYSADRTVFSNVSLILPKAISGFLLLFAVLLVLIVAIVIRHAILSSVEADYVSLGVLKALGFTGRGIMASILIQYLLIGGAGALAGNLLTLFTSPRLTDILMNPAGITGTVRFSPAVLAGTLAAVLLPVALIALLTARKAAKVSPVRAISFGKAPVHFTGRLNFPLQHLHALPLSLRLSFKQVLTKLRHYATLIVIAALFTFMITVMLLIGGNFSSGERVAQTFGIPDYDIDVVSVNPQLCPPDKLDRIASQIDRDYGVSYSGLADNVTVKIDDTATTAVMDRDFAIAQSALLEGQVPKYDNEIAVTPITSEAIHKGVGSTVTLTRGDRRADYVITGIIQNIQDAGQNLNLTVGAFKRLEPDYVPTSRSLILKDNKNLKTVIDTLGRQYPLPDSGVKFVNDEESMHDIIGSVQMAMMLASSVVMILTLLLICCITVLICTITIYREIPETAVFKSIGFQTRSLRLQFIIRFVIVTAFGAVLGILLAVPDSERLGKGVLSSVGISQLKADWSFATISFPILYVLCVTALTAFFCSVRIRRISPVHLIDE